MAVVEQLRSWRIKHGSFTSKPQAEFNSIAVFLIQLYKMPGTYGYPTQRQAETILSDMKKAAHLLVFMRLTGTKFKLVRNIHEYWKVAFFIS